MDILLNFRCNRRSIFALTWTLFWRFGSFFLCDHFQSASLSLHSKSCHEDIELVFIEMTVLSCSGFCQIPSTSALGSVLSDRFYFCQALCSSEESSRESVWTISMCRHTDSLCTQWDRSHCSILPSSFRYDDVREEINPLAICPFIHPSVCPSVHLTSHQSSLYRGPDCLLYPLCLDTFCLAPVFLWSSPVAFSEYASYFHLWKTKSRPENWSVVLAQTWSEWETLIQCKWAKWPHLLCLLLICFML